jgi:hypothetical protein
MALVKDCFDDPTVVLSVSPREITMILTAMNRLDHAVRCGEYPMTPDQKERWDDILDHVKDSALGYGA